MKSRSFALSLAFHVAASAALLVVSNAPADPLPGKQIYETLIRPEEKKLIWYRLKNDLPNIDSSTTHVEEGPARGRIRSPHVVIAESKNGSQSEFVWQDTPVELPARVKAPNLIALHPPAALDTKSLAPPPPPKHRKFVPPPTAPTPQPPQPAMIPLPSATFAGAHPEISVNLPSVVAPDQMKVYRPFVAPPTTKSGKGNGSGNGADPSAPPDAPSVGPPSNLNIVAINLDPVLGNGAAVPPGRRPGNFSSAPTVGAPAAEKSGRGTALVPGLTTRGHNTGDSEPAVRVEPAPPSIPKREIAYREVMTHPLGSSLSVPLRPGARRISAALELAFHDRPVYTMILPAPKLPQYSGDWILWFSERKPTEGFVQIRAPLPEKTSVPEGASPYTWGAEADLRAHLVIDENGRVQSLSIDQLPAGLPSEIALEDLRAWQFKPATRNGAPIAVDAVLDIPFRHIVAKQ